MTWTFSGTILIEGPIASQYPDLHRECVEDADNDDPIWEQFGKATHHHADRLEVLRLATNQTAATLLGTQEYREAFGDLAYACHCLHENIKTCLAEVEGDPEELEKSDKGEMDKCRLMSATSNEFIQLILQWYGNEEQTRTLSDIQISVDGTNNDACEWTAKTLKALMKLSIQVAGLFQRLGQHEQDIRLLMEECTCGLQKLAETIVAATAS